MIAIPNPDLPPALGSLPPPQRRFVELLARGKKQIDIANELQINPATASQWHHLPAIQEAYREAVAMLRADCIAAMSPLLPKALDTYDHQLDAHNPTVAGDVLDRVYGKPVQRLQSAGVTQIIIESRDVPRPSVSEAPIYNVSESEAGSVIEGESREIQADG